MSPAGKFAAVSAGSGHSLAIRGDGTLVGWGHNGFGQINVPAGEFTAVAAGYDYNFAIRENGTLIWWGNIAHNQYNQVPAGAFMTVTIGWYHSLAIRNDGILIAWGNNNSNQTDVPNGLTVLTAPSGRTARTWTDEEVELKRRRDDAMRRAFGFNS